MANKSTQSGGIGICGLLTVAFIVLKLCHVIDWSWWWVLGPVWIPFVIVIGFILAAMAIKFIATGGKM